MQKIKPAAPVDKLGFDVHSYTFDVTLPDGGDPIEFTTSAINVKNAWLNVATKFGKDAVSISLRRD